jgi:hypothetical protein
LAAATEAGAEASEPAAAISEAAVSAE